MAKHEQLLQSVRDILFLEWDPIGVNHHDLCRDEYDSYAPTISRLLREGVDEHKLTAHLSQLQRINMGMSVVDEDLHRRIAGRLLSLVG